MVDSPAGVEPQPPRTLPPPSPPLSHPNDAMLSRDGSRPETRARRACLGERRARQIARRYRDSRENRLRHRRSPELAKAIKAVAEGNIASNTLRRIASLSGGSGPQRAVQNLLQGGGLGYALGGPAGAAIEAGIAPVAGQVAGRMAERAARRRAKLTRAMAARGETPAEAHKAAKDMSLAELMGGLMETRR